MFRNPCGLRRSKVSGDRTIRTSSLARSRDAQWAEWPLEGQTRGEQEPRPGSWPIDDPARGSCPHTSIADVRELCAVLPARYRLVLAVVMTRATHAVWLAGLGCRADLYRCGRS